MKLRELRILLAVVKAGSMAKGAAELAISQPNVSKAISDLECALGVRLLDRGARGVEPTTYGLAVIQRGRAVFDELRHAVKDVAFLADPTSGELRLGCADWSASSVGLAIDRMSRRYPRIAFDVLSADAAALQRELKGRNIELFVAMRPESLRVRFKTSSGVIELSQHEADGGQFQEREGVAVEIFPVLGETAATVEPRNRTLDDPTLG